jgi:hypothetical protein
MDLHSIDIPGGYSGTVQVATGQLHLEAEMVFGGGYSLSSDIKFYHFCLLTPERTNIEFYLLRFPNGEWCDTKHMYPPSQWNIDHELLDSAKSSVSALGL